MILISDLIIIAAKLAGSTPEEIKGQCRAKRLVVLRAGIAIVARESDPIRHSYPLIGQRLGGRDHSSIINLCQNQEYYTAIWPGYAQYVEALRGCAEHGDLEPAPLPNSKFTNHHMRANADRAAKKRQQLMDEAARAKEKVRREDAEERRKLKAAIDRSSQNLIRFHDAKSAFGDEELIDMHISSADRRYRMQMRESSQNLLTALLAA